MLSTETMLGWKSSCRAPLALVLLAALIFSSSCGSMHTSTQPKLPANQWTWIAGSDSWYGAGVYGDKGVGAPGNTPGARFNSVAWTDPSGNFWLFGGNITMQGVSAGALSNDIWEYNLSSNEWIWIGGDNTGNEPGIYGAKGTPAPANIPGSREAATASLDSSGNVWLFGGIAYDSLGQFAADMNDLWQFNPSTNAWTWVTGSNLNMLSGPLPGVYGDRGVASAANTPGARDGAMSWADRTGNFWLFGGYGYDAAGDFGALNDLWQFNTTTSQWTWISGSNATFDPGVYGAQGIAAAGNVPPARQRCVNWIDSNGDLWLFGGIGWNPSEAGMLNDLWKFDPSTSLWTWVSGSPDLDAVGVYGTEGQAAPANVPGGRETATGWIDQNNNLWVYGGIMSGGNGYSDLWQFNPSTNMWTWESGSQTSDLAGVYGTEGTPAPANFPGTRSYSLGWTDSSGNLWLFGGSQQDTQGQGNLNDLWRYVP